MSELLFDDLRATTKVHCITINEDQMSFQPSSIQNTMHEAEWSGQSENLKNNLRNEYLGTYVMNI